MCFGYSLDDLFKKEIKIIMIKIFVGIVMIALLTGQSYAGDDLKIAIPVDKIQLDPQKIEDQYSTTIVNQIYSRLFRYTPSGQIRPDLVETWKTSKDNTEYIFKLKDSKFSDGTPITADHVVNSLKRIFVVEAALASDLGVIKGVVKFTHSKNTGDLSIFSDDQQTVRIVTEKPTSLLIHLLAVPDVGILKLNSPHAVLKFDPTLPYSGPYKVKFMEGEKIVIEKWRSSDLDSQNPPSSIVFNLFNNIDAKAALSKSATDTSSFLSYEGDKSPFDTLEGWQAVPSEASNERFIVMNPGLIQKSVRKWLLSKINTEEFTNYIGDKSVIPAFGFIPNCLPGHLKSRIKHEDINLRLSNTITLKINFGANLPYQSKIKSYLSRAWNHPNIKLEFESLPVATYLEKLFNGKGEILIGARGLEYPEGFSIITYFKSNLPSNYFFVNNKKIDSLIEQASHELDDNIRHKIYEKIQTLVFDEATVIPLAFGSWKKYFWSHKIRHVPPHPIGLYFMPMEMITMAEK